MQFGEKKKPLGLKLIDPYLKKKKKKNNLAHLFSDVVGVVGVSIFGVDLWRRQTSLTLTSQSANPLSFMWFLCI